MTLPLLLAAITVHSVITNGVNVRWFEERVPMRDGVELYTYGALPPEGKKTAIVVQRNPYVPEQRVDMPAYAWAAQGALKRGYAYVCQHVRGCGMSDGAHIVYADERNDGLDTLAWVRTLPHYDGSIFLTGGSYLSSVHWSYLDTNPPDVTGCCLSIQDVNRYNIHYRNGNYKMALHGGWVLHEHKKKDRTLKRDKTASFTQLPLKGFSVRRLGEYVADLEETWEHPRPEDAWWRTPGTAGGEYRRALLDSTMPVLMVTGFYDIYTEGICDMWRELPPARRANCALVIDDGAHGGRRTDIDEALDWFDWCRSGKPLRRAVPGQTVWYGAWAKAWRAAPCLEDGAVRKVLPLAFAPGSFTYDPADPPPFEPVGCLTFGGRCAQRETGWRKDVVTCELPPLAAPLDVQGRMRLSLRVRSDCEDTAFYVRLSACKADGTWYNLRDDIKTLLWDRADYRPGETVTLDYLLSDHAFRLEKGERLRLEVAGASGRQFVPHTNMKGPFHLQTRRRVAHNEVLGGELTLPLRTGLLRDGDHLVFCGDSITCHSWTRTNGCHHLVTNALAHAGRKGVTVTGLGFCGNTVASWTDRERRTRGQQAQTEFSNRHGDLFPPQDVKKTLDGKADVVAILLGMNDILMPAIGDTEQARADWADGYARLASNLWTRTGARELVLGTFTPLTADPDGPKNRARQDMNRRIRTIAAAMGARVWEAGEAAEATIRETRRCDPAFREASDFVHPGDFGHLAMAAAFCRAVGETEAAADLDARRKDLMARRFPLKPTVSYRLHPRSLETPAASELDYDLVWNVRDMKDPRVTFDVPEGWTCVPSSACGAEGAVRVRARPDRWRNVVRIRAQDGRSDVTAEVPFATPWCVSEGFDFPAAWQGMAWRTNAVPPVTAEQARWSRLLAGTWDYLGRCGSASVDLYQALFGDRLDSVYVRRRIVSEKARKVGFVIGTEAFSSTLGFVVTLNGTEVWRGDLPRGKNRLAPAAKLPLRAGANELVIRVDHNQWQRQFSFDFAPDAGDDLADLRFDWRPVSGVDTPARFAPTGRPAWDNGRPRPLDSRPSPGTTDVLVRCVRSAFVQLANIREAALRFNGRGRPLSQGRLPHQAPSTKHPPYGVTGTVTWTGTEPVTLVV